MTVRPLRMIVACAAIGCSGGEEVQHVSAIERGQALFEDGSASAHRAACSTCHPQSGADEGRIYPGADLRGVTRRRSFWGGQEEDLLRSVNHCRTLLQGSPVPLRPDEPEAVDLWAYLESLEGPPDAVPFTVVMNVQDLPPGDAVNGASIYDRACKTCHGSLGSGDGRPVAGIPVLPDEPLIRHGYLSVDEQRLVFIEKVRHGGFLGYDGFMPPFSVEALPDSELSDLLSALEQGPQ